MVRLITSVAKVDMAKCSKCGTCWSICPTESISWTPGDYPVVDKNTCTGCGGCVERCPSYAIELIPLQTPKMIKVDVSTVDYKKIEEICRNAMLHPKQVICFCTGTRAEEVAAAILLGARTPEDISRMTGVRTGCKVECIQPILRLLKAAGIMPQPKPGRHAWYGLAPTVFEIPRDIREKYKQKGFHFDEDEKLLRRIAQQ
ncbi:MAG: 4Fe-4S binding protein [Desulfurococcaceae archaeon]